MTEPDLSYNEITETAVLSGLPNLKTLYFKGNPPDDEEKRQLKEALPGCYISI